MKTLHSLAPAQAQSYRCRHLCTHLWGSTVPCFQGDVAVEQPVVLGAARVLPAGWTLGRSGAVRGGGAGVAPRRVVASVQGVNGGCMVLMIGRVGVGERQGRRPQPRVVLKGSVWKQNQRKDQIKHALKAKK